PPFFPDSRPSRGDSTDRYLSVDPPAGVREDVACPVRGHFLGRRDLVGARAAARSLEPSTEEHQGPYGKHEGPQRNRADHVTLAGLDRGGRGDQSLGALPRRVDRLGWQATRQTGVTSDADGRTYAL